MLFAINSCFGGFGLSEEAQEWLVTNRGWKVYECPADKDLYHSDCQELLGQGYKFYQLSPGSKHDSLIGKLIYLGCASDLSFRCDLSVIACIEALGKKANGRYAKIELVECPLPLDQIEINEYDGSETLQTIPQRF